MPNGLHGLVAVVVAGAERAAAAVLGGDAAAGGGLALRDPRMAVSQGRPACLSGTRNADGGEVMKIECLPVCLWVCGGVQVWVADEAAAVGGRHAHAVARGRLPRQRPAAHRAQPRWVGGRERKAGAAWQA